MNPTLYVAAKAVIANAEGKVLIVREAAAHVTNVQAGRYGLVGGKIEPAETFAQGLQREVREETGLHVEAGKPLLVGDWWPTVKGQAQHIVGIFVRCTVATDTVQLSDEHDSYEWIDASAAADYNIMEPDLSAIQAFARAGGGTLNV